MVPGAEARGLVAPKIDRPTFTASRPCHTIAQTTPLPISILNASVISILSQKGGAPNGGVGGRTGNETWEEGLVGEILIVLLEMSLGWGGELDGGKLEAETQR